MDDTYESAATGIVTDTATVAAFEIMALMCLVLRRGSCRWRRATSRSVTPLRPPYG